MLNRLLTVVFWIPVAIVLIALSMANRVSVPVSLDPFSPDNPALTVSVPLFVVVFVALLLGVLLGGMATWWSQRRFRKAARVKGKEVDELHYNQAMKDREAAAPATLTGGLPALPRQS
jgi:uncharacterized integral membrane protein